MLAQLQPRLMQALEPLKEPGPDRRWRLAAIAAGRDGGAARQVWEDLLSKIQSVEKIAQQAQYWLLEFGPVLPESYFSRESEQILQAIIQHLEHGGQLSAMVLLLHRAWKPLIEQARVQGTTPGSRDHFVALLMLLQLTMARRELAGRWQRQMTPLGAPDVASLGPEPERAYKQFTYQLRRCLDWFALTWLPLEQDLKRAGLQWEILLAEMPVSLIEYGDLLRLYTAVQQQLPPVLEAESNRRHFQAYESRIQTLLTMLDGYNTPGSTVIQRLRDAIVQRNSGAYESRN
jgi:hypothetical protein